MDAARPPLEAQRTVRKGGQRRDEPGRGTDMEDALPDTGGRTRSRGGSRRRWRHAAATHSHPPASDSHSASSPCLRQSLSVIPLPHTASQGQSPVSHSHSASSPYVRNTLTVIPLPEKFTHSQPPASEIHSQSAPASENHLQSTPCLRKSLNIIPLPYILTQHHAPASENNSQ